MILNVANTREFENEVKRLNKRAHKVGLAPITYTLLEHKTLTRTHVVVMQQDGEQMEERTSIPVDVAVFDVQVPDAGDYKWKLAATITPMENNEVFTDPHIKGLDYSEHAKHPYRCQHCNINRGRKWTYVVQHKDTGALQQVGRTCFADYVGHEGLAKMEFVQPSSQHVWRWR